MPIRAQSKRLRIFSHPAFKRDMLPREKVPAVLKELKTKLSNEVFFQTLPYANGANAYVRVFEHRGKKYVIKYTQGSKGHGQDFEQVRREILAHHYALREKLITAKNYILRTPKCYGSVTIRGANPRQYIVMDYVQGMKRHQTRLTATTTQNPTIRTIAKRAYAELGQNFETLLEDGIIGEKDNPMRKGIGFTDGKVLQHYDFVPAGIYKGKLVLYAVYDYE